MFSFLIFIFLAVVLIVLSTAGRVLSSIFRLFRGVQGHGNTTSDSYESRNTYNNDDVVQSEKGAIRMRNFKNLAEETEYEELTEEPIQRTVEYEQVERNN